MIGAIIGDIVGSRYEFDNIKTKKFPLFSEMCMFTDDTVMTVAVANALLQSRQTHRSFSDTLTEQLRSYGSKYPHVGYGRRFHDWLEEDDTAPYNSLGNGSAMRVSPCGLIAKTLNEALFLAKESAEVTHNHPEGIKGAQAVAAAIFLARTGKSKEEIRDHITRYFYPLNFTLDEIRPAYSFNETCPGSVPQAIEAFLESVNFEDAIRNAVSIGGDSDTIAAIAGSIAWSYYGRDGITEQMHHIEETAKSFLDADLLDVLERFERAL
ncbi:MAG: ADP-ribosylglycohydrolase family protein [Oscillospiraceae bacterium]